MFTLHTARVKVLVAAAQSSQFQSRSKSGLHCITQRMLWRRRKSTCAEILSRYNFYGDKRAGIPFLLQYTLLSCVCLFGKEALCERDVWCASLLGLGAQPAVWASEDSRRALSHVYIRGCKHSFGQVNAHDVLEHNHLSIVPCVQDLGPESCWVKYKEK